MGEDPSSYCEGSTVLKLCTANVGGFLAGVQYDKMTGVGIVSHDLMQHLLSLSIYLITVIWHLFFPEKANQ